MPDRELGEWLRQQRRGHGWGASEMARQLRGAARSCGVTLPGIATVTSYVYRWERGDGGISERYRLYYCKALGIDPGQFGYLTAPEWPGSKDVAPTRTVTPGTVSGHSGKLVGYIGPGSARSDALYPPDLAYGETQTPAMGGFTVGREVLMAAHEGGEHAEQAERRDIGDATLDQLRADVTRLSRAYMAGEPFPLFLEMRRVRNRMYGALDRRLWPRDQTEIYFLVGTVNCLMAIATDDLGFPAAAEELVRAGWAYAVAIDHRPLMAYLQLQQSDIGWWTRPRQSRDLALNGLSYLSDGPNAAQLHYRYARTSARLGEADTAWAAITAGHEARDRTHRDELLEIGGEFGLSRATQHWLAGAALIEFPNGGAAAADELERAVELYGSGPGPGEYHSYRCEALAHADLATARLRSGQLDRAAAALQPVLTLDVAKRVDSLPQRLSRVRAELAQPVFRGSGQASELDERIEEFGRDTIAADLHSLPAGPGS